MVNLTIDEKPISVPKGTNVIEAARLLGIHVPHYCYHPKLTVVGNCRMCLIEMGTPKMSPDKKPVLKPDGSPEIAWIPRPQIGCATSVSEGMAIKTRSKLVEDCRKGVMEFLLINHPLDCPICDQAGECRLQEYSVEYGSEASRFIEPKEKKPKKVSLGSKVMLDDERCILCSRCIRFCKEVAKDDVLGFVDRGGHTSLTCYPGKQLENNYSLNTVDICPVGALTSRDFRFKMRVWFLKETKSICTSCSTGCNVVVGSREGVLYRYTPRQNDAVNSTWMCDHGRLNYKWINDARRLVDPLRQARPVPWPDVIGHARRVLEHASKEGNLAMVASARASTEELFLMSELVKAYQPQAIDIVKRQGEADGILLEADRNPNTRAAEIFGLATGKLEEIRRGIEDGKIKTLLVQGENLEKVGFSDVLLAKLQNLIVLDILPSPTTDRAHVVLPAAAHVEKHGTFINGKGRIQRFAPAFPLKGRSREDWLILSELLPDERQKDLATFPAVFKQMTASTPALKGVTWDAIGDQGLPLSEGAASPGVTLKEGASS
ncbi:MAG: molybdopterin-dependent oxidoreductase [Verrucomicrobiae bacterium]|nr:molybdopterin-dependent oxidoreductase [Verrucomicrobiae bacterium]